MVRYRPLQLKKYSQIKWVRNQAFGDPRFVADYKEVISDLGEILIAPDKFSVLQE